MSENDEGDSRHDRLTRVELLLAQVAKDTSYLRRLMVGDGDSKAVTVRLDRLEQTQKRWGAWLVAIGTATLAGIAETVRRWLGG